MGEVDIGGIPTYHYEADSSVFSMSNPDNFCYCPKAILFVCIFNAYIQVSIEGYPMKHQFSPRLLSVQKKTSWRTLGTSPPVRLVQRSKLTHC